VVQLLERKAAALSRFARRCGSGAARSLAVRARADHLALIAALIVHIISVLFLL
jgi:hypothetical protein